MSRLLSQKRENARYAYLYLDGTYGLWAQMGLVTVSTVCLIFWDSNLLNVLYDTVSLYTARGIDPALIDQLPNDAVTQLNPLGLMIPILGVVCLFWNLKIVCRDVPSKLFKINGYTGQASKLGKQPKRESGPWLIYQYSTILGGAIVINLLHLGTQWVSRFLAVITVLIMG
ncbi:MAG: hypothetical protein AAFU71_10135 [Cyanobacteria bacterium J06632_22]